MREYQERLMREMQKQREEHEKQLMEQKLALLKHQVSVNSRRTFVNVFTSIFLGRD